MFGASLGQGKDLFAARILLLTSASSSRDISYFRGWGRPTGLDSGLNS